MAAVELKELNKEDANVDAGIAHIFSVVELENNLKDVRLSLIIWFFICVAKFKCLEPTEKDWNNCTKKFSLIQI